MVAGYSPFRGCNNKLRENIILISIFLQVKPTKKLWRKIN